MRPSPIAFVMAAFLLACAGDVAAQALRSTLTFDNQSGQTALVKLVGPTAQRVEVPRGGARTVRVAGGRYTLLARYGADPQRYLYSRSDPFTVDETAARFSAVTIPLHELIGDAAARRISKDEFERGVAPGAAASPPQRPTQAKPNKYRPLLQVSLTRELRWDKSPGKSRRKYGVSVVGEDPGNPISVGLTNVDDTWGPLAAPRHSELIAFVRATRPAPGGELALLVNDRTVWTYTGRPPEVTMRGFGQADLKAEFIQTPVIDLRPYVKPGKGFLLTLRSGSTGKTEGYAIDALVVVGR